MTDVHLVGDAVLTEFARRIAEVVRESDTLVGGVARSSCPAERCSMTQAVVVAEKLQAAFAHPVHDAGEVTVSIGVAEITAGDDLDSWIHRADDAGRTRRRRPAEIRYRPRIGSLLTMLPYAERVWRTTAPVGSRLRADGGPRVDGRRVVGSAD